MSFNPRARDGRELCLKFNLIPRSGFNPRARDGRESVPTSIFKLLTCFNPRARDGREDLTMLAGSVGVLVSIHAPVMDANQINSMN